jgi:type IV secretion system protein VirD4
MGSRQETARPLLTQGEVMQLPADQSLVLVSGLPPIRAAKLRYYEDRNFRARLLPPPVLDSSRVSGERDAPDYAYADRPAARADDWSDLIRTPDVRLAQAEEDAGSAEDGGLGQERHPCLTEDRPSPAERPRQLELIDLDQDDASAPADARALEPVRRLTPVTRAYGLNDGRTQDLLPGI